MLSMSLYNTNNRNKYNNHSTITIVILVLSICRACFKEANWVLFCSILYEHRNNSPLPYFLLQNMGQTGVTQGGSENIARIALSCETCPRGLLANKSWQ